VEIQGSKIKAFQIREATQEDIDTFAAWRVEEGCASNPELFARLMAWRRDGRIDLPPQPQTQFANMDDVQRMRMLVETLRLLSEMPPRGHAGAARAWVGQQIKAMRDSLPPAPKRQAPHAIGFANSENADPAG
jgi:hypothetical protein